MLLLNGSDAEQMRVAVARFVAAFGAKVNLLVSVPASQR
jgi:hypothetical protein